jgi:predicted alpha-1,6-mannanase (GH76 family)
MRIVAVLTVLFWANASPAFTSQDADLAFEAFNTHFYAAQDGFGHYQKDTGDGSMGNFWNEAEEIEMIEDVHERTGRADARRMITEAIDGFTNHFGLDWTGNKFNDDIMWMTIACARGYLATSNTAFLGLAKWHFHAVYNRAWDDSLGGGLWWTTNRTGKNACINGPAALAACLLYQISGDPSYLAKAKMIYAWERTNLFDAATGAVFDNKNANSKLARKVYTYNEGTFIGAANFLWKFTGATNYFKDALLGARFVENRLCQDGILPMYGSGDAAGFNGIFVRWQARFAGENQLWPQFHKWLLANANAAWKVRRADNLSWQKWGLPTPAGTLESWNCSDTVVILQVVPTNEE